MWTLLLALQANAADTLAPPLCEASGLTVLDSGAFIAIDNEEQDRLFQISPQREQTAVALPQSPARDYEAVVAHNGLLTVVASHSRKKLKAGVCRVDSRRAMFGWAPTTDLAQITWVSSTHTGHFESADQCHKQLFGDVTTNGSNRLCGWLAQKDAAANNSKSTCRDTLNIEGAAVIDAHLWVGLRAPLVDGAAVLLRIAGGLPVKQGLLADRVVYVEIAGGIRAMAQDETHLYFVSDGENPRRWRVASEKLQAGARLTPEAIDSVLADTEGLAVTKDFFVGVTDGSAAEKGCKKPSQRWQVARP